MPSLQQTTMQSLYRRDIWREVAFDRAAVDHQGWNGKHAMLQRIAFSAAAPLVLDVGVWKGESTITIAGAMKRANLDGCVIAIDTFLGSEEHWDGPLFQRTAGLPDLHRRFVNNVLSVGLQDYVVPFPQTSATAAAILKRLGISASAVHIDASHAYEDVVGDSRRYWELLSEGGVLVGDDYCESWKDVMRAADDFAAEVGRGLHLDFPKWLVQK